MNADILHDGNFPHGTPNGYNLGCHGSHCPSAIPCRDVHTRYRGDWAFRKQVDAGMTPAQIIEQEHAHPAPATVPGKNTRNRQYTRRTPGTANTPTQKAIKALLDQGLTDTEIAEHLGKTRDQVCSSRRFMQLPANRKAPATTGASS